MRPSVLLTTTLSLLVALAPARGQHLEPVRYTVRIPAPATHYIEVEASYPTGGRRTIDLMMPVWTPGSYLVREFARNVEGVRAMNSAGASLEVHKTRKNRWAVQTGGASRVTLAYRVYGHERAGRLNWVEESFALLNGAPTYITLLERAHRPHEVALVLPAGWTKSVTSLHAADAAPHHYRAADYDELVDSPIVEGNPQVREFVVDGKSHYLVNVGDSTLWDTDRSVRDLAKIAATAKSLWGVLPYDKYVFFNMLVNSYDGIEHKGSTVLLANRLATKTPADYNDWIGLAAHEFTHAWNVKRLRPVELGPFDYENETYTTSLWIAEGFTDYYSWLIPPRAGITNTDQFLTEVSGALRTLLLTAGPRVQPVAMASYDTWIKQYRPDENSANTSISYYTKGSLIGLVLDAKIRRLSNDARSLDDVMRGAYALYSGAHGYTPAQFQAVASRVAGVNLGAFFHAALDTTEPLDFTDALDWYGLRITRAPGDSTNAVLGPRMRLTEGHWILGNIARSDPVYGSALDAGDEIVQVDDAKLGADGLEPILRRYRPGTRVTLTISRLGERLTVPVTLGREPDGPPKLVLDPAASAGQKAHLRALLST